MDLTNFQSYLERSGLDKKPHQYEAVAWCVGNELHGVNVGDDLPPVRGGLIADEMGLGKTIQMLGTIVSNFKMRTLIVLPLVLLDQWDKVIQQTLGHRAIIYHGSSKRGITLEMLKNSAIVLTTYGMIAYDRRKADENLLYKVSWQRVVYDEAHHLRNHRTNVHLGSLHIKSKIRWLITGTPIQNAKRDFFSICAAMGIPSDYYTDKDNLLHLLQNFVLRRSKADVGIVLPSLDVRALSVGWKSKKEKWLSKEIHSSIPSISNLLQYVPQVSYTHLEALTYARQSCIYPGLLKCKLVKMVNAGTIDREQFTHLIEGANGSSKLDAVVSAIVERKDNGNKKIVFCHYRGEIDEIEARLKKTTELTVSTFDGRTSKKDRKHKLINSVDVLILQIQTACEGLNLQDYNEVYFVSPHWNPAVEDQAIARCHRIGQRRNVEVIRFQMSGEDFGEEEDQSSEEITKTLEEYCLEVQDNKRKMREIMEEDYESQDE